MKIPPLPHSDPPDGLLPPDFIVDLHQTEGPPANGGDPSRTAAHRTLLLLIGGALVECAIQRHPVISPAEVPIDGADPLPVDIAVYPRVADRKAEAWEEQAWHSRPRPLPLVVIDVLFPQSREAALARRPLLLDRGVREVWHVEVATRAVVVHTTSGFQRYVGGHRVRSCVLPSATMVPASLFDDRRDRGGT